MRRCLLLAALVSTPCWADTPYSFDISDLWWNPSESGWGLNIAQQDDTAFGTMFVYGPDGRARWFSASEMKGSYASGQGVSFSGRLVESVGPQQPGFFNSSDVVRRDVGQITLQTRGDNRADLTYTVDGVTVTKQVERLTMKGANASGEYTGHRTLSGCIDSVTGGPASIRILQDAASFTMTSSSLGQTCTYTGTPEQRGRLLAVRGSYTCALGGRPGTFEISNMNVTYQGFMAHLYQSTSGSTCASNSHIGGVSSEGTLAGRASVDISDLWWNPDESGWGINFQQQDNLIFATIFTYGVDRQAKWYSASDMRLRFVEQGGLPSFDGALYESTGPGYSTSFNPGAVTRRRVGDLYVNPILGSPDELNLMYYIDGVQYLKHVKRLTMKGNDSSGSYRGSYAVRRSCPGGTGTGTEAVDFTITQLRGSFSMTAVTANQTCTYSGFYEQRGRMVWSPGSYFCTGNLPEQGNYRINELEVGQEGLIAQVERTSTNTVGGAVGCTMSGRIAGVRTTF